VERVAEPAPFEYRPGDMIGKVLMQQGDRSQGVEQLHTALAIMQRLQEVVLKIPVAR
jgi:hypothetical protein